MDTYYYCYGYIEIGSMPKVNSEFPGAVTQAVFHMLVAVADGPIHGYAIMKSVSRTADPAFPRRGQYGLRLA